jgi:hypothetical protein
MDAVLDKEDDIRTFSILLKCLSSTSTICVADNFLKRKGSWEKILSTELGNRGHSSLVAPEINQSN